MRFTPKARPERTERGASVKAPTADAPPSPTEDRPPLGLPAAAPQDPAPPGGPAESGEQAPPPTPAAPEQAATTPTPAHPVRPPLLLPAQSKAQVLGAGPPQGPPASKFPAVAAALEAIGEAQQAQAEAEAARTARVAPAPKPVPPPGAPKKPSPASAEDRACGVRSSGPPSARRGREN
jgi:hypothetical protein